MPRSSRAEPDPSRDEQQQRANSEEHPPISEADQSETTGIDWRDLLILNKKGKPLSLLANIVTALAYADEWHDVLAFNEFNFDVVTRRPTPWGKPVGSSWADIDDSRAAVWLQREVGILVNSKLIAEAVQIVAQDHKFHPLREEIASLKWDGVSRLDTWPIVYLGAPDTPYVRAVGRRWMISLMARLFVPGCKADHVLMLEGRQGKKKSTALMTLVGEEYFADRVSDLGSKDSMLEMSGAWLIEMSELPNLRGDKLERFKAFITSCVDRFRLPYGRRIGKFPRQCVLAASTNSDEPFIDPTGTRRIWPIRCGDIKLDLLKQDRDQLMAEAYACYREGEPWYLETAELEALATTEQDERYEPGVWDEIILDWVQSPKQSETLEWVEDSRGFRDQVAVPVVPWDGSEPGKVTITDVLIHAVGKNKDRLTQADYKQVARCLAHARWKLKQDRTRGAQRGKRFYLKPADAN